MSEVKTKQIKRMQSFDTRVKAAILQHEKTCWSDAERANAESSPNLKLIITFEGLDIKANVVENRHEFTWRPKPNLMFGWRDLEKTLVLTDFHDFL